MSTRIEVPAYEFLSQPPSQQQKKRILVSCQPPPSLPLPLLPCPPSETRKENIASWALLVQPGSPGTPSPRRSSLCGSTPSHSRRPSLSHRSSARRRPSVSRIPHIRVPSNSTSFLHLIDTPSSGGAQHTPSICDHVPNTADLRKHGYTAVHVSLPPTTPQSAVPFKSTQPTTPAEHMQPPTSAKPIKTLHRFRSLSILRPSRRARSTAPVPSSPTKRSGPPSPTKRSRTRAQSKPRSPTSSSHKERKHKNRKAQLPPPLASELMLMQFMDGGNLESHTHRLIPEGDAIFRDGKGGLWRDGDEEGEYAGLLNDQDMNSSHSGSPKGWVGFSNDSQASPMAIMDFASETSGPGRRGSEASIGTAELLIREPMVIDRDIGKLVYLPPVVTVSTLPSGTQTPSVRSRRQRPAPLNLVRSVSDTAVVMFEDSFIPAAPTLIASTSFLTLPSSAIPSLSASPISLVAPSESSRVPKSLKSKSSMARLGVKNFFKRR